MQKITPFLWFDDEAEAAVELYTSLFSNSTVHSVQHYGPGMPKPEGSVMLIAFELESQQFSALNGGPHYKHSPAFSLAVSCDSQAEVDRLWDGLLEGGAAMQCGWLSDRFGVSWQIVPRRFFELLQTGDAAQRQRVMAAMMTMVKLDLAELERAARG